MDDCFYEETWFSAIHLALLGDCHPDALFCDGIKFTLDRTCLVCFNRGRNEVTRYAFGNRDRNSELVVAQLLRGVR